MLPRVRPNPRDMRRTIKWLDEWQRRDPDERHWHVGPVAVEGGMRGLGIGARLMEAFAEQMDRAGDVAYLETDKPENVVLLPALRLRGDRGGLGAGHRPTGSCCAGRAERSVAPSRRPKMTRRRARPCAACALPRSGGEDRRSSRRRRRRSRRPRGRRASPPRRARLDGDRGEDRRHLADRLQLAQRAGGDHDALLGGDHPKRRDRELARDDHHRDPGREAVEDTSRISGAMISSLSASGSISLPKVVTLPRERAM